MDTSQWLQAAGVLVAVAVLLRDGHRTRTQLAVQLALLKQTSRANREELHEHKRDRHAHGIVPGQARRVTP